MVFYVFVPLPNRLQFQPILNKYPLQLKCLKFRIKTKLNRCLSVFVCVCILAKCSPEFKLIWLVSELLRLCAELCNEFKLLASLSINLFAASNLANRLCSDVGNASTSGAAAIELAVLSIKRIDELLLLVFPETVKVIA